VGALSGNADSATTVADNAITNAKLADMPSLRIKGRLTSGIGDPEDLVLSNNTSTPLAISGYTSTNILTAQSIDKGLVHVNNQDQISTVTIYAPTTAGTSGDILRSAGSGTAPVWTKHFYESTLSDDLFTTSDGTFFGTANTNWTTLFSFNSVPAGRYMLVVSGQWRRSGTATSRAINMSIVTNSGNYIINVVAERSNSTATSSGTTTVGSDIDTASSTIGATGTLWSSTTATTTVTNAPFQMIGFIRLYASQTVTIYFRQTASSAGNIVGIYGGSSAQLVRVE
jgi:hypothetical protein